MTGASAGTHTAHPSASPAARASSGASSPAGIEAPAILHGATTGVHGATAGGEGAAAKAPLAQTYGVGMHEAIETVKATVELAARHGAAQAKIALEPAELGAVKIHLTQTSEGISARVTASTAAGAAAISSGRGDLHGMLSSVGVTLLSLDINHFDANRGSAGGSGPGRSRSAVKRAGSVSGEAEEIPQAGATSDTRTIQLRTGSLVDVLA